MIGKISIGKSFRGCIAYVLNDKKIAGAEQPLVKRRAEVLLFNQCFGGERELIRQFNEVRQLNPRLAKPVLHITLSLPVGETIATGKLADICEACAREMGFDRNQYFAIRHRDTRHQHIHIVANRVGFDKKTVSDSQNFQKMARFCRRMETAHQLTPVLSPRRFLSREERLLPRQDARKEKLKAHIQHCLTLSSNYPDFYRRMQSLGYQVEKGRGICFIDSKQVRIKGSEVGFSLATIEKILTRPDQAVKPGQHLAPGMGGKADKVHNDEGKHNMGAGKDVAGQMSAPSAMAKVPESPTGDIPLKRKKKKKYGLRL